MSDKVYQVVGECAHVTTDTPMGRAKVLVLKGGLVPPNAPELEHLLSVGLVAQVGGDETGGVDATGETLTVTTGQVVPDGSTRALVPAGSKGAGGGGKGGTPTSGAATGDGATPGAEQTPEGGTASPAETPADPAEETEARRQAAREKLATLEGRAPDGRYSQDVLVEYLVQQGGSYDDLIKADKADLVEMVKARQQ